MGNGTFTLEGNSIGDTVTYTCDPGFDLSGSATLLCTQTATPSPSQRIVLIPIDSASFPAAPTCIGKPRS